MAAHPKSSKTGKDTKFVDFTELKELSGTLTDDFIGSDVINGETTEEIVKWLLCPQNTSCRLEKIWTLEKTLSDANTLCVSEKDFLKMLELIDNESTDYFDKECIFSSMLKYAEDVLLTPISIVKSKNFRNWTLYQQEKYVAFHKETSESYEYACNNLGIEHPSTLDSLYEFALSYLFLDVPNYFNAKELFESCYEAQKRVLGEEHQVALQSLNCLAYAYDLLGDHIRSNELYETCYEARKKVLGKEHPDTLIALNNLATSYATLGNYTKSKEFYETRYETAKRLCEGCDEATLLSISLSSLYELTASSVSLGEYTKAKELREITYEIYKKLLGKEHPDTLNALDNLAASYAALGDYTKAKELYETCYKTRKRLLGENHPDVFHSLNHLAAAYVALGEYTKAKGFREIAEEMLGSLNLTVGEYIGDIEFWETDYEINRALLGEEHSDTLESLDAIAVSYYYDQEDYAKAKETYEICYKTRKRVLGEEHPDTLSTLDSLARSYRSLGDYAKAKELYETCYETRKRVLGEEHSDTLETLDDLALLYRSLGDYVKAKETLETCYEINLRAYGEKHPNTLKVLDRLAYLILYWL